MQTSRVLPTHMMMLVMLPTLAWTASAGDEASYVADFKGEFPESVYKSIDASGHVAYSGTRAQDAVSVEAIALQPRPSAAALERTRHRFEQISKTAQELARAREMRLAEREEREMKRLERLALQRSAAPQVYERKVYLGWYPWWPYSHPTHVRKGLYERAAGLDRSPGLSRSAAPLQSAGFK